MTVVRRWKQGATTPPIEDQLLDANGDPINLTGATVRFLMGPASGTVATVAEGATIIEPATAGVVRYQWGSVDLGDPGLYRGYWEVVYSGGAIEKLPQGGAIPGAPEHLLIRVTPDLAEGTA